MAELRSGKSPVLCTQRAWFSAESIQRIKSQEASWVTSFDSNMMNEEPYTTSASRSSPGNFKTVHSSVLFAAEKARACVGKSSRLAVPNKACLAAKRSGTGRSGEGTHAQFFCCNVFTNRN